MTHRDVGYARLSHADPDEAGAIARQKQDIRQVSTSTGGHLVTVDNHQGEPVEILVDNAVSASRYARRKRKDYPLIETYARAGLIDRAVIYDVDRLLRIPRELEDLIDLVEDLDGGFTVVAVNGELDLTTADGRFFARMRVAQAAKESDDLSRRIRRQIVQGAERGVPRNARGRARPFGFADDGIAHNPDEAALIRQAAEDVLYRGVSLNEIARRWNAAGHRTARRNTLWSNRTVRAVLCGPRAAGLRIHHRGEPDEQTFPAAWDPIIDRATHEALKGKLIATSARRPSRRTEYTGLFVGVADGESWPMRRDRNRSVAVYRTYQRFPGAPIVRMQIGPAADLEGAVRELLFAYVESGRLAEKVADRIAAEGRQAPAETAEEVQALIDQADADEVSGVIDRRGWLLKRKLLVPRLQAAQHAEARVSVSVLDRVPLDIRAQWGDYEVDHRAAILREVFDRIEISPGRKNGPGFDRSRVRPVWR